MIPDYADPHDARVRGHPWDVFPLHAAPRLGELPPGAPLPLDQASYLDTVFFIAQNGIALTAAHCVPSPDELNGKTVIASV